MYLEGSQAFLGGRLFVVITHVGVLSEFRYQKDKKPKNSGTEKMSFFKQLVSPEGLRRDGRRPGELRRLRFSLGTIPQADGSCTLEQGNTVLGCAIYGPREPARRSQSLSSQAQIKVQLSTTTNSSPASAEKAQGNKKKDRRILELQSWIRQTFESVICLQSYPRSEIQIHLQVLQLDGGLLAAAMNAATLALIDAGVQMNDYLTAVTVSEVDGSPILDCNYMEESMGSDLPILTMALLPRHQKSAFLNVNLFMYYVSDRVKTTHTKMTG
jgi:exosome complex component RRP41